MKPYDHLTIIRNRHRAKELRTFRELIELWFDRSERDPDGMAVDWEGAQEARSRINQMLPRIIQIVRAAGVGGPTAMLPATDPGLPLGRLEVLHDIFSTRYLRQEILDVLDMALGVYDGDKPVALMRTINPFHYAATAIAFLARGPRRLLDALGLRRRTPPPAAIRPYDLARLEAIAARLANSEELIEARFAELQDRQARRHAETSQLLSELAGRLDFAERVLGHQRQLDRLSAPQEDHRITTPV